MMIKTIHPEAFMWASELQLQNIARTCAGLDLRTQEPLSSWGALLSDGANSMEVSPWLLLFPAGFLVVTLFCFNFIGDGLRDALDPKDR